MQIALPEPHASYSDAELHDILKSVKTIAVVGLSSNPTRPSREVFEYMLRRGYRMIGVNPGLAGQEILSAPIYGSLADIPTAVDMVDIFRNSALAGAVVDEALELRQKPKVIWMQLNVHDAAAAHRAEAQGLRVIMNRCPKTEYARLFS